MKIIGNLDWRNPLVRARVMIASPIQKALAAGGRWEPVRPDEKEIRQTSDSVSVRGDRTTQHRVAYKRQREIFIDVEKLVYTPQGLAAKDGRYIARYSLRTPSTAELLKMPSGKNAKRFPKGTIVETETPYTYGDWVMEYIQALVTTDKLIEPLILPSVLAEKAYVIRDVEALGLTYIVADSICIIECARILRKRIPSFYWRPDDVAAYRKGFKVIPPPALKGSIIYLGRFDFKSEAAQRHYPSEAIARIVESLGGMVIDTRELSPEKFDELAPRMETVIADQGSALFGVMHSQTKNVIELTEDDWWCNANPFVANGSGVENYAVIHIYDKDERMLRERIEWHLREFGASAAV